MPGLALTFTVAASAVHAALALAIGSYFCGGNDDDPTPRDSYYSRSSLNSGATRIQTQPSYRPPPLPQSYTYRPAATNAQTTPRTPAPPDRGRGVSHPSVVSPYTRTPNQTQPSSTRVQPSPTFTRPSSTRAQPSSTFTQPSSTRVQPSITQSASTSSRVPSCVPTERDPLLPTASSGVYHSNVVSPYTRTPSQTQPSSTLTQPSIAQSASTSSRVPSCLSAEREPPLPTASSGVYHSSVVSPYTRTPSQTQPSSTRVLPTSTLTQSSSTRTQPSIAQSASTNSHVPSCVPIESEPLLPTVSSGIYHSSVVSPYTRKPSQTQPSSTLTQPSSAHAQPSSALIQASSALTQAFSSLTQASSALTQASSTLTQASHEHSSLSNTVHVDEPPPEYENFQTSPCVPSRVHTERDTLLPTVIQVVSSSDLRSDEQAGVEDLDFAEKLREQARRRGREMSEARSRAKSAKKKGYRGAAQAHRQEAIAHESAMKELNKRAAKIIFKENNKVCS